MDILDLSELRKSLGLKQKDFANNIGIAQSYLSELERGVKPMTEDVYRSIEERYGTDLLIKHTSQKSDIIAKKTEGVPYYENIDVTGGIATLFQDNKEIPTFYINYEHFNDCTAYVPVVGDSMYPKYASGEIIAVKRIYNLDIIQWGEAYLVVTNGNANDLRTVKLLHPHDDESKIVLRASNPNFKGDTVIDKCDIISLFLIKGKITRNQL